MPVATVVVRGQDGRPLIINKEDFRPGQHVLWEDPAAGRAIPPAPAPAAAGSIMPASPPPPGPPPPQPSPPVAPPLPPARPPSPYFKRPPVPTKKGKR